jgi:Xaa-Pro dipeptidase
VLRSLRRFRRPAFARRIGRRSARDTVAVIDDLPFAREEFARRLAFLQADLVRRGFAGGLLIDPENIFWTTGYRSIGYFTFQALFVPVAGAPVLVSRIVNKPLALATPTIGAFVAVGDNDEPGEVVSRFLRDRLAAGATLGVETAARYCTVMLYRALERGAAHALADWNGACEVERQVKSSAQLERMRHAARAAVAGLDAAVKAVAPGRSENDVAAAMLHGAVAAGSEYFRVPLVVTGPATALCFTTWQRRQIERGHVVLLESAANVDRYHAVIGRTCIVGRAAPEHRRVADALLGMLDAALHSIRSGVTSGEVHAKAFAVLDRAGLSRYHGYRLGYAIGIGFPPNWAEGHFLALRADDPTVLQPGMTFHVIPSLFTPEFGMWFSESVAVTAGGCEVLTDYPRRLIEIDA